MIYRDRDTRAECTVRIDGFGDRNNRLAYATGESAPPGTLNEMMHGENDNQTLYFKPLGIWLCNNVHQEYAGPAGRKDCRQKP